MKRTNRLIIALLAAVFLLAFTACTTTRSEQGVTIKEKRDLNPLNYIPIPGL